MSLKVLLSQPIVFVPETTTRTTHASGCVPVPESVSTLISAIPVSRSSAIALSSPQGGTAASAVKASGLSSSLAPSTSAFLPSSTGGERWYGAPSSVSKKRGYEAIALPRPQDGSPSVKRRKVSSDVEVAIRTFPVPMARARGLRNSSGVHCYRNASIQALGHVPAFRDKIRRHFCRKADCPACALRGAFCDHFSRSGSKLPAHEPKELKTIGRSVGLELKRELEQEDCQEYISLLLARLADKSEPGCALERAFEKIFGASKISETECVNCGHVSASPLSIDKLSMLSLFHLRRGRRTSLEELLEEFTKEEHIEDYRCEACRSLGCNRSEKFVTPPRVAIFCLKRFSQSGRKDNRAVSFPERLSWRDYTNGEYGASELTAVICHVSASLSSGHYVCYLKTDGGDWLEYNDSKVTKCKVPPTKEEKGAYVLMYSKL
ncbi:hypothetical protein TWF225_001602 [Orbilia oligospora]|uniref:ubiquitinyl hydrolase 1 n=1 Tax=Orbilia oligospora TaxID=2813651 RepID=A0A7C8KBS6_ORBOL|nr:hypothetical protein TWF225_001602 [Orbilia oligospora]KAF3170625.1 hypothetical protein TWF751_006782 [Orbilia oligospora]KAF3235597.1 hypothetical protein TWF128_001794 [Orbilia oligospora]KAF3238262.1 hypothetical protein TWF217_001751 [Orbilia oligospora]KAF3283555.1 hypothetical protein TWF132_010008 [Orbilia oligospora]